jgi:hypothetical protein
MPVVYRFKVMFEDHEDVVRDIEITNLQTFEDFHNIIQSSIGFDASKPASFFICTDHWIKEQEIVLEARKDKDGNDIEGRIISRFYSEDDVDENGEPQVIDPLDFLNKKGSIIAAIRFESIFVGKDIKIQVKIYEAAIKTDDLSSGFKRLLRFGNVSNDTIININMESSVPESDSFQINTSDQISLDDEDDESSKKLKKKSKK